MMLPQWSIRSIRRRWSAADLQVSAEFVEYDGLGTYTVQLQADTDNDGVPDFLSGRILTCDTSDGGPPSYVGVAVPTTVSTPGLSINRNATIGDAGFQVLADGMVPNQPAFLLLAFALAPQPRHPSVAA